MTTETLQKTPLHAWHRNHGGRLVDFAGWSMPVQYGGGIVAEHQATRQAAGLFDISHMGRLVFSGSAAADLLSSLLTKNVQNLRPGRVRYALLANHAGGVIDDVLVSNTGAEQPQYWLVVNASNRPKILTHLQHWQAEHFARADVQWLDQTDAQAMLAVQGPQALPLVDSVLGVSLADMKYYTCRWIPFRGFDVLVSRTGYTGEDGFEMILPAAHAMEVWEELLDRGQAAGVSAAGLGCRDTLRLEAGMPLYGHELSEEISPFEAGLAFAVDLDGRHFCGGSALSQLAQQPPARQRVGLTLAGKRLPRQGYPLRAANAEAAIVGEVTSGTFAPTLQQAIAMGFVPPELSQPGTEVTVDIRGQMAPATVVELPFYRRAK